MDISLYSLTSRNIEGLVHKSDMSKICNFDILALHYFNCHKFTIYIYINTLSLLLKILDIFTFEKIICPPMQVFFRAQISCVGTYAICAPNVQYSYRTAMIFSNV